jgi:membrane-associated PAP2 superfamily phosphatase
MTHRFRTTHVALPALGFVLAFAYIQFANIDFRLATAQFYDAATRTWVGGHTWWAEHLIHNGGRNLVRAVAAGALVVFVASWRVPRLRTWRLESGYVVLAIALGTGIVGLLKQVTNVDCPWDLTDFGGTHAFVSLLGQRPAGAAHVACFPGAHSSSGFALMCFYFVLRDRDPRAAVAALAGGILTGATFAFGQEARGAHFLSHDLASAAFVWYAQLAAYTLMLAPKRLAFERHPVPSASRSEWRAPESDPRLSVALNRQESHS